VWLQALSWTIAVLLVLVIIGALAGSPSKKTVGVSTATSLGAETTTTTAEVSTSVPVVASTPITLPATTLPATTLPVTTVRTTVPRTAPPTAPATTAPTVAGLCGAPANPFGYNFCGRGTFITSPNPSTCSYFNCIANFGNGIGYMEECADATYSMSGGRQGSCSHHGGDKQPVFSGP
jgi:hypothetical protein